MRDPKRIKKVLKRIREIWEKYPDLRLMQLLGNCFHPQDAYHVEDDALIDALEFQYQEAPPSPNRNGTRLRTEHNAGSNPAGGANSFEVLHDLLLLVGYDVPIDILKMWEPERRQLIEDWASAHHLAASDNIIEVPERPDCLDGYEEDDTLDAFELEE